MSLLPGPLTFTQDRLRKAWREFQPVRGRFRRDRFQNLDFVSNRAARQFCLRLLSSVQDPSTHLPELAASFDSINLRPFFMTNLSESVVSALLPILTFQCRENVLFRFLLSSC